MGSGSSISVIAAVGLVSELVLRAEVLKLDVWQLSNGRAFAEEDQALAELERQRESERGMVVDTLSELLRLSTELSGARPTPARLALLQELVVSGLVPQPVVAPTLDAGSVTDAVWEAIKPLSRLLAPRAVTDLGWLITLSGEAADAVELPDGLLGMQGEMLDDAPLPAEQLLRAIVHLQSTGWCLQDAFFTSPPGEVDPDTGWFLPDPMAAEFRFSASRT